MNNISRIQGLPPEISSGIWINPQTGKSFKIKDTIIEDNNQFSIITDTGEQIPYSVLNNYIQTDMQGAKDIKNQLKKTKKIQNTELPPEVLNELEGTSNTEVKSKNKVYEITNYDIIKRIIDINNTEYKIYPTISSIKISQTLKNRILGLINLMGFTKEEVITWCIDNLLDLNIIKDILKKKIENEILSILNDEMENKQKNKRANEKTI